MSNSLVANLLGEGADCGDQLNPREDHIDPLTGEAITDDPLLESAVSDYFLGHDHDALDKIKASMKGKVTKAQKQAALDEIDDLIDNSNRTFTMPTLAKGIIAQVVPGAGIAAILTRLTSLKDRKKYREMLYDLRSVVKATKTVD